jgi:hypothetical protein
MNLNIMSFQSKLQMFLLTKFICDDDPHQALRNLLEAEDDTAYADNFVTMVNKFYNTFTVEELLEYCEVSKADAEYLLDN